jgi:hypothetical protein
MQLGEGSQVGVVVHAHRQSQTPLHLLPHAHPVPAGKDRRGADRSGRLVDRTGKSEADADHLLRFEVPTHEYVFDKRLGRVHPAGKIIVVGHLPPGLGEDLVGEIGDRHGQMALAEVDPDGHACRAIECDQPWRPAAPATVRVVRAIAVDDHAGLLELGNEAGHGGA